MKIIDTGLTTIKELGNQLSFELTKKLVTMAAKKQTAQAE